MFKYGIVGAILGAGLSFFVIHGNVSSYALIGAAIGLVLALLFRRKRKVEPAKPTRRQPPTAGAVGANPKGRPPRLSAGADVED